MPLLSHKKFSKADRAAYIAAFIVVARLLFMSVNDRHLLLSIDILVFYFLSTHQ